MCIIGILLFSGCSNKQTPVEKMYEVLEKVVSTEKAFEDQQVPLVELEKKEKGIYDHIISLGMKEFEEITKLSNEASVIVGKRKKHMDIEQESIEASKAEFQTLSAIIEEVEEPLLKEKSLELYDIMMERYNIHNDLYQHYSNALKLDKGLYEMFKKEDLQLEQLENQISKINEEYAKVLEANEMFNEKTNQYNETKLSFYKEAGLEIKTKK
ncbi:YkyA family protein [Bacillus sp. FJAT-29790]|nr:YkyA family protein [Bacillus sp. FJAT-29790]MBU8877651.1 YkyA family protein [Bacillus sp. FJAT-29790]